MHINKKTKIIATIGPSSRDPKTVEHLIKAGVNIFRFNMKHGTIEWHAEGIKMVQAVADELETPVGILIDLQGPEIRIQTKDAQKIIAKTGDKIIFAPEFVDETVQIRLPHQSIFDTLTEGNRFSIDDGFIPFKVVSCDGKKIVAKVLADGEIGTNKGLNLFGIDIDLPSLIKDDIEKLNVGTIARVDYVALSFTRTKEDILILKKHLKKVGLEAKIISKVESQKALDNIDEIIEHSDGVMIARGDLGVETPIEKIAYYQKQIIVKCRIANTPVIVATQMLQSMVSNPLPTRAEATDVANAIFDGTDAIMLSGETASGKYPIEAVTAMAKIALFNETQTDVTDFEIPATNATQAVIEAAQNMSKYAENLKINHIVVLTETGYTAKVLSSFRPKIDIIAATDNSKTVESLTMSYGVNPIKVRFPTNGRVLNPETVIEQLLEKKMVKKGDMLMVIHGQHWKTPGQTNSIILITA